MSQARLKDRLGFYTAVPDRFIEDSTISHEAFRLFVVLRQFTNAKRGDDIAFPSYDTLKERCNIQSFSTIAKKLRELEAKGWIHRKKRFGKSTVYSLVSPTDEHSPTANGGLHQVDTSATPDGVQSYTPSKTNQKNLTTRTNQKKTDAAFAANSSLDLESPTMTIADSTKPKAEAEPSTTAIPQSDRRVEGDQATYQFERHLKAQENTGLATIRKWNLPPHLLGICEDYVDVAKGTTVKATDKKLYIAGASDIYELFKASGKTYSRAWMVKAVETTTWTHAHPRAVEKTFRELFKIKWQPAATPASDGFKHVGWQKNKDGDMVQVVKAVARG